MKDRLIERKAIISSVETYEIIESYPEDKYLPSCLVYANHKGEPLHIQFAIDVDCENVRVVTAYHPTFDKWENNFRNRRKK